MVGSGGLEHRVSQYRIFDDSGALSLEYSGALSLEYTQELAMALPGPDTLALTITPPPSQWLCLAPTL